MTSSKTACLMLLLLSISTLIIASPRSLSQSSAFNPPSNAELGSSIDRIRSSLSLTSPPSQSPSHHDGTVQPESCGPCVKNLTEHIIVGAINITRTYCAHATGRARQHCNWIAKHPNFFLGYLWEKLQPVYQSFLYCSGAQQCYIHGNASVNVTSADAKVSSAINNIIVGAETDLNFFYSYSDNIPIIPELNNWMNFDEGRHHRARYSVHERRYDDLTSDGRALSSRCKNCLKLSTVSVIKSEFVWIGLYCIKHKDDPDIKAECAWIAQNLPFTAGYLYGRTQPWEVAIGYCVGNGACALGTIEKD